MTIDTSDIIAIIGFMGSGKSTIGARLASRLKMEFVDLDEAISEEAGKSIRDIFEVDGEEVFRELEQEALRDQLERGGKVISCGGGIVLRDGNIKLMRERCRVFFLQISEEKALQRLMEDEGERPLLDVRDRGKKVIELMSIRADRYLRAAHVVIEADRKEPEEIVEEIAAIWNG